MSLAGGRKRVSLRGAGNRPVTDEEGRGVTSMRIGRILVLAALATVPGIAVYRTDEEGRVVVESDGQRLRVRTEG